LTVAYIAGTFDLLHYGHVRLFRRAKERFDRVIVAVNRDDFVARFKRRPVMNLEERMEMIAACRYVDAAVVNVGDEDSRPTLLTSHATHFIHGSDWTGESLLHQLGLTQAWLDEHKIEMVYFPYTQEISTTMILARLREMAKTA
jgi:glycerol-3-phosphate cytidylyltransferase